MIERRAVLAGLGSLVAAPAVIRTAGLLMPVRVYDDVRFRLWRQYRDLFAGEDTRFGPWVSFVERPVRFAQVLSFAAQGDFIEHRGGDIGLGTAFDEARAVYRDAVQTVPVFQSLGSPVYLARGFSRRDARRAAGLEVPPCGRPA